MTITPTEWTDIVQSMAWLTEEEKARLVERFTKPKKARKDDDEPNPITDR